jgi:hypothetical protein
MGKVADFWVFDGHNDVLSCLQWEQSLAGEGFFAGRDGDIDLLKCRAGGFGGGFSPSGRAMIQKPRPIRWRFFGSFPALIL